MSDEDAFCRTFDDFMEASANIRQANRRLSQRFEEVLSASPLLKPGFSSQDQTPTPTPASSGQAKDKVTPSTSKSAETREEKKALVRPLQGRPRKKKKLVEAGGRAE